MRPLRTSEGVPDGLASLEVRPELDSGSAGPEHASLRSVPALNPPTFVVHPRTQTILVVSSDPQERMRLVRRFLKDGFDVDAYGLWHPSLIDALDVCDAAVVDTQSYAQVLLATTEIPDTMAPPRCVVIANDDHVAERLRLALRLEIFIRPVNASEVSAALRKLCCTPGIEGLGASINEPIGDALMRWATEERTIAVEGRWRHERGTIYIDGGEIFHARAGSDVGEHALDRMLYWPTNERRFWTLTALRPQRQTIYGDPELALLDAGHRAREIKSRVDRIGGLDSVWTFDWKAFQEQEEELSFSVDQLLPWLEGTDYLARKIFVADAELVTTLRVVEDLIQCGVLKQQAAKAKPYPQSRRGNRRGATVVPEREPSDLEHSDMHVPESLSPTLAEERLPSVEGRFNAADFSDSSFDEPLAPLLEEKEGILAETDRLRAQLAALEAEKRAHGAAVTSTETPGAPTANERADRATRLFWRQVAFEQHARLALTQLKQRNHRLDGRGENPTYVDQLHDVRIALGDDSGLFAIAREASTFARELRDAAGTMRGEEPDRSRAEHHTESIWVSEARTGTADYGPGSGTDRFGFAGMERSRTDLHTRPSTVTRPAAQMLETPPDGAAHRGGSIRTDRAPTEESQTTTAPRVRPSGSYQVTPRDGRAQLRRPVTEPQTSPSGSYLQLRPVDGEDDRSQRGPGVSVGDESTRNVVEQRDFLRTEIPVEDESQDENQAHSSDSEPSSEDQSVRSGPPPFRSLTGTSSSMSGRVEDGAGERIEEEESSELLDDDPQIFSDSYDEALEDALDELFDDPRYRTFSSDFDTYEGLESESVLENSAASLRDEISDIWLPPDAVERPSRASAFGSKVRKKVDTDQQPITTIRSDGKDLQFVHAFPSSEHESVEENDSSQSDGESSDERVTSGDVEAGSAASETGEGKPFERYGGRRGTGPTNTLLLSAVPAPDELREMIEGRPESVRGTLRYDHFEEENTPVAGVERVSEVVLGKSGFRDPHESDRTHVITSDVDDLSDDEFEEDIRDDSKDDDTVDLPSGSALLKLIDEEAERSAADFTAQNFDGTSDSSADSVRDLSVYEPRPYVWAITSLMLVASILILMMSDDEDGTEASLQSSERPAVESTQNADEVSTKSGTGFQIMLTDDGDLPSNSVELDVAELSFGISHGGETANDVRRSAAESIDPSAPTAGSAE